MHIFFFTNIGIATVSEKLKCQDSLDTTKCTQLVRCGRIINSKKALQGSLRVSTTATTTTKRRRRRRRR